jgi:hypothetical protein
MEKLIHLVAVAVGFIVFSLTNNIIIGALAGVIAEAVILPVLFVTGKKRQQGVALNPMDEAAQAPAQKQSLLNVFYYIVCAIYLACSCLVIFVAINDSTIIMVAGAMLTVLGCVLLFIKRYFGILLSLFGSVVVMIGSFVHDVYASYIDGHFDTRSLVLLLLLTVIPGLILLVITLITTKGRLFKSNKQEYS